MPAGPELAAAASRHEGPKRAPGRWLRRALEGAKEKVSEGTDKAEKAYVEGVRDALGAVLGTDEKARQRLGKMFGLEKRKTQRRKAS